MRFIRCWATTRSIRSRRAPGIINAQMAAVELSLDKNWLRYRTSFFYASGDKNPRDGSARGFDTIFDNPNFAGGFFSFWDREGLRLTGTGVGSGERREPGSRSSIQQDRGPGELRESRPVAYTMPEWMSTSRRRLKGVRESESDSIRPTPNRWSCCCSRTPIHAGVGADSGIGLTYRPPLSENIVVHWRVSTLLSRSRVFARSLPIELCSRYSPMSASASKSLAGHWRLRRLGSLPLHVSAVQWQQQSASSLALCCSRGKKPRRKSTGCVACHGLTDSPSMHTTGTVRLGCIDCHGGNAAMQPPAGAKPGIAAIRAGEKAGASAAAQCPSMWKSSANPVRPFADWLKESKEYIQFVNPGDLRVAERNLRQVQAATSRKCAPSRPA